MAQNASYAKAEVAKMIELRWIERKVLGSEPDFYRTEKVLQYRIQYPGDSAPFWQDVPTVSEENVTNTGVFLHQDVSEE